MWPVKKGGIEKRVEYVALNTLSSAPNWPLWSWSMIQGSKAIFLWDISSSDWGISVKNFIKFCFETYSFIAFLSNYVPAHQINFVKIYFILKLISEIWWVLWKRNIDTQTFETKLKLESTFIKLIWWVGTLFEMKVNLACQKTILTFYEYEEFFTYSRLPVTVVAVSCQNA